MHQYIATGAEETAAAAEHFRTTNTAPKNSNWGDLTKLYVAEFDGVITEETKERIEATVVPSPTFNKYGETTTGQTTESIKTVNKEEDLIAELARLSPAGWLVPQVREYSEN